MANAKKLFDFSRSLPKEKKLDVDGYDCPNWTNVNPKQTCVSKYSVSTASGATRSTILASVVKAVYKYMALKKGELEAEPYYTRGCIAVIDALYYGEYPISTDEDAYILVKYNEKTGEIEATMYDRIVKTKGIVSISKGSHDATAIFFTLMPLLLKDEEFSANFSILCDYMYSEPHTDATTPEIQAMAILSDNVYRRFMTGRIEIQLEITGNITPLSDLKLAYPAYDFILSTTEPKFMCFEEIKPGLEEDGEKSEKTEKKVLKKADEAKKFNGKYFPKERTLTPLERKIIPHIREWEKVSKMSEELAEWASATTNSPFPIHNFLLRGPSSTGKSVIARQIAVGLGLPFVYMTCSADTEMLDLIGQLIPSSAIGKKELKFSEVAKDAGLPTMDDILCDVESAYTALTGKPAPSEMDSDELIEACTKLLFEATMNEGKAKKNEGYQFVPSPLIKAVENGWVCELQEANTIRQEGILVGLNALFEDKGCCQLCTGETISRHPDTVLIITCNKSYAGTKQINQSVLDRFAVKDVDFPSHKEVCQRVGKVFGIDEKDELLDKMVSAWEKTVTCTTNLGIEDGTTSIRRLQQWVSYCITFPNNVYKGADLVIQGSTEDDNDQETIRKSCIDPYISKTEKAHFSFI